MSPALSLELFRNLQAALEAFYRQEATLLEQDLHVRCLGARLIKYLEQIDPAWQVYLDYNYQPQTAYRLPRDVDSYALFPHPENALTPHQTRVRLYPQLAVLLENKRHLALELHKSSTRRKPTVTLDKLRTLTDKHSPLRYTYGFSVLLPTGSDYQAVATTEIQRPYPHLGVLEFSH